MADEETTQPEAGQPTAKTFTEAELNSIIKDRLDRERKKYADYDSLKSKASKADEYENATKTETQRLADKLESLQKALEEKERAIAERDAAIAEHSRRAIIGKVATDLGALDPYDANILLATVEVNAADPKAEATITEKIKALTESKPYLFKSQPGAPGQPPAPSGLAPFNPTGGQGGAMSDMQRVQMLRAKTGQGNFGPF